MTTTLLKNDRLIRALLRQPVDCTPVWIMRQAGRYLPEYRELRAQAKDFLQFCKTPELACEATLQPLRRFDLDAAIIFSDILTIPDAMGLGLHFVEGEGPQFQQPIRDIKQIQQLSIPHVETHLNYVMQALQLTRQELAGKVPLIGFAGSPWTLATYMVEGGASKEFIWIKKLRYQEPAALHELLNKLALSVTDYLTAQITAGAQAIMLFDSWGGILSTPDYEEFSLCYMQKIIANLPREYAGQRVPVIVFTKGGNLWLEQIANSGCDAVGVDWTINLNEAKKRIGHQVALQGNLDPVALFAPAEELPKHVNAVLQSFGQGSGHVFNLGHGINQHVNPENVAVLVDAVHSLSKLSHARK